MSVEDEEVETEERAEADAGAGAVSKKVVNLNDARKLRAAIGNKEKVPLHIIIGESVIGAMRDRGEDLLTTAGQIWRYRDGLWSCPVLEGRRGLEVEIEAACRGLSVPSNNKLVSETRQWILRHPDLFLEDVQWDGHGKIPTRSGLIDPVTLAVDPPSPKHFATWRVECEFDPAATCPWWLRMLDDSFADREPDNRRDTVELFQEVIGAGLVENKPRALTRALVLEGASETGKTRLLDVASGLLSSRPISTPFEALATPHGLMEFTRRAPWVLNEAFDQGRWHLTSTVKSILTGDPVQINIKNGPLVTQRVRAPVFWGTNHPPQFREATKAIVNRIIIIQCRTVFASKKPIGAAAEALRRGFSEPSELVLATEMPGLLNWAIAGLRRAMTRGFFNYTAEMEEALETVRTDSNIVAGFIAECVTFDPVGMVSVPDFCAAFTVWWQENKGEDRRAPSNDSIGRAMVSFGEPRICTSSKEMKDNQRRYYGGIQLNQTGLDYWRAASTEGLAKGKTARISSGSDDVNRYLPSAWDSRPAVVRMRAAFEPEKGRSGGGDTSGDTTGDTSGDTSEIEVSPPRSVTDTSPRF